MISFWALLVLLVVVLAVVAMFSSARRDAVEVPLPQALGGDSGRPPTLPPSDQAPGWALPHEPLLPPVSAGQVNALRDRLGDEVRTLDPDDDDAALHALADASERYSTCRALLEGSSAQAQLRTAWLAAAEGLTAARLVRERRGLDPAPPMSLPPSGPSLAEVAQVDVDGRFYLGGPDYGPGRPHWFPGGIYGGRFLPAGWYDAPFWPGALLLDGLADGVVRAPGAGRVFGDDDQPW